MDEVNTEWEIARITPGKVAASVQLAERLKELILQLRLESGARLPSERELMDRSGLSRVTVRTAVARLENEGWVVRRQGLGTFVHEAMAQELSGGAHTITEAMLSIGIKPAITVLSFQRVRAPAFVRRILGIERALRIKRLYADAEQPVALVDIYLPLSVERAAEPLRTNDDPSETTYTMWENRLGVRISQARHQIRAAAAAPEVAEALGLQAHAPVLTVERTSFAANGDPLEVVVFSYRPERYGFTVTLPRTAPPEQGVSRLDES
jgi:GntR family transcriptional regulator